MPRTHLPYPPEFRRQMVELVRSGRAIRELAREFECSDQTIRNWVRQADRDEGRRDDGLTSVEREELRRLRRENRQLREEREWRFSCLPKVDRYWQKPRPGSLGERAVAGMSPGEPRPCRGSLHFPGVRDSSRGTRPPDAFDAR